MGGIRNRPKIGLFVQGGAYAYQAEIIFGAHDECEQRNLDFYAFAGGTLHEYDPRSHAYEVAASGDLDGAILVPGTWGVPLDHPQIQRLLERLHGVPLCIIGGRIDDIPSVCVDNAGGVQELVRHLIEAHGRRRIGFITGHGLESVERVAGYKAALRAAGLRVDPELIHPGNFMAEAGRSAVARWFGNGEPQCDAIVTANDWMAIGALHELDARGIRVPDDVAVVGFDDIEQASFLSPPLTTIRQPPRLMGMQAVALIEGLRAGTAVERHLALPTLPQLRQSCGCFGRASALQEQGRYSTLPPPVDLQDLKDELVDALKEVGGPLARELPTSWAKQLVVAMLAEIERRATGDFIRLLGEMIVQGERSGNITAWHHVIAHLRERTVGCLARQVSTLLRAETLFGSAHVLIGERAERVQGKRLMEREAVVLQLEDAAVEARTALDTPTLKQVISKQLPLLGVPSCYVAVGDSGPNDLSAQLIAFDQNRALVEHFVEKTFRTGELIPDDVRPPERHSMVVHPLFVREEVLGFCCLEIGPRDGSIYKALGDIISSAVKAAQLSEALVEEATRRERAEQARMAQELEIAARIQTAILPRHQLVEGLEVATTMLPAAEVGGDYFDILPFQGGCWLGIGDVAGHGLPTGIVMLMIQSLFAAAVHGKPDMSPGEAWQVVNAVLTDNVRHRLQQDEHATLSLIRYKREGNLAIAGAHEDLLVWRRAQGRCELVPTPGIWAGIREHVPKLDQEVVECRLEPGDVLLLYTDGIIEARHSSGEEFGVQRLQATLAELSECPVHEIRDQLMRRVTSWMHEQADDLTLVVARYVGVG